MISRSPTDLQPVLDALVKSAARVCGIDEEVLRVQDGNAMVCRAHCGPLVINRVEISIDEPQFHWMRKHGTLHIPDARTRPIHGWRLARQTGVRTLLTVPLLREGAGIGTIMIWRD